MNKKHQNESTNVTELSSFRQSAQRGSTHQAELEPAAWRARETRERLLDRLNNLASPAVAIATVFLSQDGTVTLFADGIEPEFSPPIVFGLNRIASRIEAKSLGSQHRAHRQRGSATLLTLISLSFALATYFNDIAWVDAALSIGAQAAVALAMRPLRRRN